MLGVEVVVVEMNTFHHNSKCLRSGMDRSSSKFHSKTQLCTMHRLVYLADMKSCCSRKYNQKTHMLRRRQI